MLATRTSKVHHVLIGRQCINEIDILFRVVCNRMVTLFPSALRIGVNTSVSVERRTLFRLKRSMLKPGLIILEEIKAVTGMLQVFLELNRPDASSQRC